MESVTEQELLEEVRRALENWVSEDDAMTTRELAECLDVSVDVLRLKIPGMIKSGLFEPCRVYRRRWDGILNKISAIRLKST